MTCKILNLERYYRDNPKLLEETLDSLKRKEFRVSVHNLQTGELIYEKDMIWLGELQDGDILTVSFDLMMMEDK